MFLNQRCKTVEEIFYSKVQNFRTIYVAQLGLSGACSKKFDNAMIDKLVKWDSINIRYGVRGGSDGEIYQRWDMDSIYYNNIIIESMLHARFLQII